MQQNIIKKKKLGDEKGKFMSSMHTNTDFHCLFCLAATGGVKWPPVDTKYISFISNDLGT